ncbi:MAG TPA: hypothetical protein VHE59_01170 [Mucilaginibacter sp.]|nr:hypothetical protein [Mucilaginibacter sp.]
MPQFHYIPNHGYAEIKMKGDKPLLLVPLDSKLARRFAGFGLIKKDLDQVKEALQCLAAGVNSKIIKQSLSFYAVVTYAKCFSDAEGRGVKLDVKDALIYASKDAITEHYRLIEQRNNYVAHAGDKGYEENAVVVSVDPEEAFVTPVYPNIVYLIDIDSQLNNFFYLVQALEQYITENMKKNYVRLEKEIGETGIEQLLQYAIHPDLDNSVKF